MWPVKPFETGTVINGETREVCMTRKFSISVCDAMCGFVDCKISGLKGQ